MNFENAEKPMRICTNHKEVLKLFEMFKTSNTNFFLWQNQNGKRVKSEAFIFNIDKKNKTIAIKPSSKDPFQFSKPFKVYIYGDDVSLLFKTSSELMLNNMVIIDIPKEIRLVEKRKNPRIDFNNRRKSITIHKHIGYDNKTQEFKLQLLDISQTGIAFIVFSHDLSLFSVGSEATIVKIGKIDINNRITGKIMYTKEISKNKSTSKSFRIGIKFNKEISTELIDQINKP